MAPPPSKMLVILTTTIRVKNTYNANIIVIIFVGKLYTLINGIFVSLFTIRKLIVLSFFD